VSGDELVVAVSKPFPDACRTRLMFHANVDWPCPPNPHNCVENPRVGAIKDIASATNAKATQLESRKDDLDSADDKQHINSFS